MGQDGRYYHHSARRKLWVEEGCGWERTNHGSAGSVSGIMLHTHDHGEIHLFHPRQLAPHAAYHWSQAHIISVNSARPGCRDRLVCATCSKTNVYRRFWTSLANPGLRDVWNSNVQYCTMWCRTRCGCALPAAKHRPGHHFVGARNAAHFHQQSTLYCVGHDMLIESDVILD